MKLCLIFLFWANWKKFHHFRFKESFTNRVFKFLIDTPIIIYHLIEAVSFAIIKNITKVPTYIRYLQKVI